MISKTLPNNANIHADSVASLADYFYPINSIAPVKSKIYAHSVFKITSKRMLGK
jgi:hypothetical protein